MYNPNEFIGVFSNLNYKVVNGERVTNYEEDMSVLEIKAEQEIAELKHKIRCTAYILNRLLPKNNIT